MILTTISGPLVEKLSSNPLTVPNLNNVGHVMKWKNGGGRGLLLFSVWLLMPCFDFDTNMFSQLSTQHCNVC